MLLFIRLIYTFYQHNPLDSRILKHLTLFEFVLCPFIWTWVCVYSSVTTAQYVFSRSNLLGDESLDQVLTKFRRRIVVDKTVSRRCSIKNAFRAIRHKFDSTCNLYVKFSGEMGLDHVGPKREFFRQVFELHYLIWLITLHGYLNKS